VRIDLRDNGVVYTEVSEIEELVCEIVGLFTL